MALKKYKPITAGTRWRIGNAYAEITTNVPEKVWWKKFIILQAVTGKGAGVCVTLVADIKECIVLLILKEIRKIYLQ